MALKPINGSSVAPNNITRVQHVLQLIRSWLVPNISINLFSAMYHLAIRPRSWFFSREKTQGHFLINNYSRSLQIFESANAQPSRKRFAENSHLTLIGDVTRKQLPRHLCIYRSCVPPQLQRGPSFCPSNLHPPDLYSKQWHDKLLLKSFTQLHLITKTR